MQCQDFGADRGGPVARDLTIAGVYVVDSAAHLLCLRPDLITCGSPLDHLFKYYFTHFGGHAHSWGSIYHEPVAVSAS
jgi:hypothetical protein